MLEDKRGGGKRGGGGGGGPRVVGKRGRARGYAGIADCYIAIM